MQNTRAIWNPTILNLETFQIQYLWRSDFKGSGFFYSDGLNHLKSRHIVLISNGFKQNDRQLAGFKIPFEIWTSCKPTSCWLFKIQTRPDLRSPLYSAAFCSVWDTEFRLKRYNEFWPIFIFETKNNCPCTLSWLIVSLCSENGSVTTFSRMCQFLTV